MKQKKIVQNTEDVQDETGVVFQPFNHQFPLRLALGIGHEKWQKMRQLRGIAVITRKDGAPIWS